MAVLPKCKYCSKEVDKDLEHVKRSGRYYHAECYEKYEEEKREKKARKCVMCDGKVYIGEEGTEKDYKGYYHTECFDKKKRIAKNREELCEYIAELYQIEFPTGFMLKQMDEFYKKRGYSYKSMYATLMYMYEVENLQVKEGTGLGLIPYYYDKAKNHFAYLQKAKNSVSSNEKKVIQNKAEKIKRVNPTKRKVGMIDISNL